MMTVHERLVRALQASTRELMKAGNAIGSCDHDKGLFVCDLGDQAIANQELLRDIGEEMVR